MTLIILSLFSMYFTCFFHISFEPLISYFPILKDNFFIHFFQFSIIAAAPWKILFHLQRSLHSLLAIRFLHLRPSSLLETKPMSTPLKLISGEENHSNIESVSSSLSSPVSLCRSEVGNPDNRERCGCPRRESKLISKPWVGKFSIVISKDMELNLLFL